MAERSGKRQASRLGTTRESSRRCRWFWQSRTRTRTKSFEGAGCGYRAAATTQRPMKRLGQMSGVTTAAGGVTSEHSAPGPPLDAAGVRRSTQRRIIGAPSTDAGSRKATGVDTPWPSAQTAEAPTSRRLTPAQRRRRPAATRRGGGPLPQVEAARRDLAARRAADHRRR